MCLDPGTDEGVSDITLGSVPGNGDTQSSNRNVSITDLNVIKNFRLSDHVVYTRFNINDNRLNDQTVK